MTSFAIFASSLSEEACLAEVFRLRRGEAPCDACGSGAGFAPTRKHRAFACRSCGFKVYPCQGTPFSKPQPSLQQWFYAIHLSAKRLNGTPRVLARALGTSQLLAEHIDERIALLGREGPQGRPSIDWFEAVAAFTEEHHQAQRATRILPGVDAPPETPWRTLIGFLRLPDFERRPALGAGLIGVLVCVAIGASWLLVPAPPEEDAELVQATALLSLVADEPVLLVSQDVAEQLYDVTDLDAAPSSPLSAAIRLIPTGVELKRVPVAEARPLARPSVKLAPSVGKSILSGDLSDARKRAADRPELAAYASLANALETSGPVNPDEILTFGPMRIRRYLVEKIVRAARITSMDPVLLMAIADKESSFATEVQAQTSSATGLFQFIEKTWLGVVRDFGTTYGLEREAQLLAGALPAAERTRILALRRDAYLSAVFAAEMLKRDGERIGRRLGRPLTGGETYLVHFLGPDGAERLIARAAAEPNAAAAELLPKPAEANRPIFYTSAAGGKMQSLSVSAVRDKFETMIGLRLNRYRNVHAVTHSDTAEQAVALPVAIKR
ncbi:transglycosylase SLT domain-containing protein [Methylorubrum aminovorans]